MMNIFFIILLLSILPHSYCTALASTRQRIPMEHIETTLLTIAAIGGSIGDWICMRLWHHKTMYKKSKYGIPFIITLQIALVVYLRTNKI